jgi:hypothetical protein
MYRNVYFHKVVRSAEGMVKLALQRARLLAAQDRLPRLRETNVYKALLGQRMTMAEFAELDDVSVLSCFKEWARSTDPLLASLTKGLLYRRVFKTIELSHLDAQAAAAATARASDAVKAAGGEPAYELFYDEPASTPYEMFDPKEAAAGKEILVQHADGRLTPFAQVSPMTQALNRQLMFRRLHVAGQWKETVVRAIGR